MVLAQAAKLVADLVESNGSWAVCKEPGSLRSVIMDYLLRLKTLWAYK